MSVWRALRRRVLTPSSSATRLDVRRFHVKDPAARALLETIGSTFLSGYASAAEARTPGEAEGPLERIATRFRGFAYEGAAMGFAIRDGLPLGGSRHVATFLRGRADDHIYMAYVGVGWAMARLPRFRWSTLYAPSPLLRWLVLDGYGFHQAFFRTERYVHEQFQETRFPWPVQGPAWYANRAIDQGIGRAMWFVGGADAAVVTQLLGKFPDHRLADLYSGAGLAATYAGGADEAELRAFWHDAGRFRPLVAQGSAFAAAARLRADLVVAHNELATQVFCGMPVAAAAKVTDDALGNQSLTSRTPTEEVLTDQGPTDTTDRDHGLPDPTRSRAMPAYEVWRQRIANEFVALGRC